MTRRRLVLRWVRPFHGSVPCPRCGEAWGYTGVWESAIRWRQDVPEAGTPQLEWDVHPCRLTTRQQAALHRAALDQETA